MTRELLVQCDRCRRPVVYISTGDDGQGLVFGDRPGYSIAPHPDAYRNQYVKAAGRFKGREVLDASPDGGYGDRWRLACTGRRHGTYERTYSRERLQLAVANALVAGRNRIGMREI